MDPLFAWIEQGWLSVWIRESESIFAFPGIIVLHTLGMGLLAGTSAAIDLRLLGFARGVPIAAMDRFTPVLWTGFAVNAFSGVLLLIAYPTKALTNPLFYLKIAVIALALWVFRQIRHKALRDPPSEGKSVKYLATLSLLLWATAIGAGRLLAYTYTRLLVGD